MCLPNIKIIKFEHERHRGNKEQNEMGNNFDTDYTDKI